MAANLLNEAYHLERAFAARHGITRYPCNCQVCHGFKDQTVKSVQRHHRLNGRDITLVNPLLVDNQFTHPRSYREEEDVSVPLNGNSKDENFPTAEFYEGDDDSKSSENEPVNTTVNFARMAEDYFSRADEIHSDGGDSEESVVDFNNMSASSEEEPDDMDHLQYVLQQSAQPLFPGSTTSSLRFSVIFMSLCTLFLVSRQCLDEFLTFFKQDVLPPNNLCPKNSYEMKAVLLKLGLAHKNIHCCFCGKTLYWKENARLVECPSCLKSRYILGSRTVPVRVLRYFPIVKRLRRLYRCPVIAEHLKWHATNHSTDGKMRSVVDGEQWKYIDNKYPSFSRNPRNIRLGLSLDGVNPYSMQSSKHSVWPVLMVMYNLPPYLVTKKFFLSLTMIIPGPHSPSDDSIDVYMQPLVHELKKLWVGVSAVDMSQPEGPDCHFKLRAMLIWTINDFPAYTLVAGQVGKGYAGCPVCGQGTFAEYSKEAGKMVYLGNRRWLPVNHRWRDAEAAFNGVSNHDSPPSRQTGLTIVQHGAWRESFLRLGGRMNSEHDPVKRTCVKRVSIFYNLPYWMDLPTRQTLDPMHCEKNLCDNLIRTLFGENDGAKSREDLQSRNIRHHLHLQPNADGVSFFMPDAPYVLSKDDQEKFLSTLRDLKFPSNYVASFGQKIVDGKLRGLKTHDYHILMQQLLPLCLRNLGDAAIVGAIIRMSRVFQRLCSKVVDYGEKQRMLEDVVETVCSFEKELPPSIFVIMMHLPIHLVEELFICGPVHTRWMFPFERFMKELKGYVRNKCKPEGSMANGYTRQESVGFVTEYLSEYSPTTKRAWDDEEEPIMYDEVMDRGKRDRHMDLDFQKSIHDFVLDNTVHMEPYRRKYIAAVADREAERKVYRQLFRRSQIRGRFSFPEELRLLPEFAQWTLDEVRRQQWAGVHVDDEVVDTARGPLPVATAYKAMFAYGNHFRMLTVEKKLKTADSGVAATFRQVCRTGRGDVNQVVANIEYVGHVEEILELSYTRHKLKVLVCDFVKANYMGENATIRKDMWGFTLANYSRRPGYVCQDSFAFPSQCEQVFFSKAKETPGWRIVLRKDIRGKRILLTMDEESDPDLFQMGRDEDFLGLLPERDVGEQPIPLPLTGRNIVLQETLVPGRRRSTAVTG